MIAAFIACWLLHPAGAAAEEPWPKPAPQYRLLLQSTLGGSYNSEGVEEQVRLGMQMLLYRSDNPIFRDNFVFVGAAPRLNPTAWRAGPSIEIQPLTALNVRMSVEPTGYFGTFSSVQSFASPLADFSATTREHNADQGKNYPTTGVRLSISPFLQAKVGPIVVRDRFTYEYIAVDIHGDKTFYETAFDTMIAGTGTVLSNELDVFYLIDLPGGGPLSHGRIAAGARYTMFEPTFTRRDFRRGEDPAKEHNEVHRVGPLLAFSLFDDGYTKFHEPTIVAMVQWYAAHRNRTGRDMDQAFPYLVLAFLFQSDLWTSAPAAAGRR